MSQLTSRTPAFSETCKTEVVCPNDTNPMGILQGGRLVEWMDIAAAVCAQTHSGKICVTAAINHVSFDHPARIGDIIHIKAKITRAFSTSMEVAVQAHARTVTDPQRHLLSEAFFSFVALDESAKPTAVPQVLPETEPEQEQYLLAAQRKQQNKQHNTYNKQ
jgi:acyl-CoA hydrolase